MTCHVTGLKPPARTLRAELVCVEELPLDDPAKPAKPWRPKRAPKPTKLVETKAPSRRSASQVLPENWLPDEAGIAYAQSLRLSDQSIAFAIKKFRSYYRSTGGKRLDWDEAFRVWVTNEAQRALSRSSGSRSESLGEQFGV